jgi:hypothetical protein
MHEPIHSPEGNSVELVVRSTTFTVVPSIFIFQNESIDPNGGQGKPLGSEEAICMEKSARVATA